MEVERDIDGDEALAGLFTKPPATAQPTSLPTKEPTAVPARPCPSRKENTVEKLRTPPEPPQMPFPSL